ncbi:ABC transporter substrate-binding protein [Aureimonas sp. SK2]|uniref:ABC transporter substrate-binding protein n=1 Tax=Aureimonas sp. SK2 TaxID=3015992 RepID=UPI002444B3A0|nr:ABC transporter substrate-binding protein [Aureimonas sp. SK2]
MSRRLATRLAALAAGLVLSGAALGADASGAITLYTSQPNDQMTAVVEAFRKDTPNVSVEIFRAGTTELMAKLQAEFAAGGSPADVVLIADTVAMTQLKEAGRLLPYAEAPVEGIPANLIDADRTYFGTKLITTGIVYNTDKVTTAPTSWNDLKNEDAASQLIMPSPLYSGAAVVHVGTMTQDPAFGWDYYEALAEAGAVAGQGNGTVLEAVARGEKSYGMIVDYMAMNAKAKGSPVAFVFPSEGVSTITQPVAILKSTDNPDAAKAFVDWQLGRAAQEQSVAQGYFPVIEGMAAPAGYPEPMTLKVLPTDSAQLVKDEADLKMRFSDLFGG